VNHSRWRDDGDAGDVGALRFELLEQFRRGKGGGGVPHIEALFAE
jgi:hypothetical protein